MWPRALAVVLGLAFVIAAACGQTAPVQPGNDAGVQETGHAVSLTPTVVSALDLEATAAVEVEATVRVAITPTAIPQSAPSPTAVSTSRESSLASPTPGATRTRPLSPSPSPTPAQVPTPTEVAVEGVAASPTPALDLATTLRFRFEGAVVYIETPDTSGSGFLFEEDGWIITNAHVVGEHSEVSVALNGTTYIARVVGLNERVDVAVVKVDTSADLLALSFGNADTVGVGDQVVALGYSLNSRSGFDLTTWEGVVTTLSRGSSVDYVQTDAAVGPQGTGGPVLNSQGEVIGISTNRYEYAPGTSVQGASLAISIDLVKAVLPSLQSGQIVRITPTPTATPEPKPWRTYDNGLLRFTIKVAPGWMVDESPEFGVVIARLDNAAKVQITSAAQTRFTLDDFEDDEMAARMNEVRGYLGIFELVSSDRVLLSQGQEAVRMVYWYRDTLNFCDTLYTEYLLLVGGYEYMLLGSMCDESVDAHLSDMEEMERSFVSLR